jgi:hypothetical protein
MTDPLLTPERVTCGHYGGGHCVGIGVVGGSNFREPCADRRLRVLEIVSLRGVGGVGWEQFQRGGVSGSEMNGYPYLYFPR